MSGLLGQTQNEIYQLADIFIGNTRGVGRHWYATGYFGPVTLTASLYFGNQVSLGSNDLHLTLGVQLSELMKRCYRQRKLLLRSLWPLGVVPAAFAAFLVWNGGVVLGDRAAHAPVKHCMQPLYFALFAAGAAAPIILAPSVYVPDSIALPCISASPKLFRRNWPTGEVVA